VSVSQITLERDRNAKLVVLGVLLTAAIFVIGLYIVKWSPYWHKAHVAAATHNIGKAIVSGNATVGLQAGWTYTLAYFKSVWEAVVLALLLGASVQAFVPRAWLLRAIGKATPGSAAVAAAGSMTTMMCTCCTGPVVVGLRRQAVAAGSALAFFLGNPVLNPATLIFMGFVLGWQFVTLRIVLGIALVFAVAMIANRMAGESTTTPEITLSAVESQPRTFASMFRAWLRELWIEIYTIIPGYVAIVFIVGALQAWLFPPGLTLHASGIFAVLGLSALGTIFVIPTAGEVPIVQTLTHAGMGIGPAAALMMTLPAISLPSLYIVRNVFSGRVLAMTAAAVFVCGIVAGVAAMLLFPA
jgi:uncharacterized membrane protein YraQ (UPF0718 family)